jgi:hypothetical protein
VELVGRVHVVGQSEHGVFEGQQGARINVEFDVQVNRPTTAVFGVQIYFPCLAQRIGFYEVSLVVHVEPVRYRMVL